MRRPPVLAFALLVAAAAPVWARGGPGTRRLPPRAAAAASFGDVGQGSWNWFGDPRAVYVGAPYNEVFVGWLDWSGQVTIAAYNTQSGATSTEVIGQTYHDDHSSPSILVEPDKRLTVFYSAHNGSKMYYRTTINPADISAWGQLQQVPSNVKGSLGFTYPNPVLLAAEENKL